MPNRASIALMLHTQRPWLRRILSGLASYGQSRPDWRFVFAEETDIQAVREIAPDGIITMPRSPAHERDILSLGAPVVGIVWSVHKTMIPLVTTDNRAVGRLAGEHVWQRGYRRLCFVGTRGRWYSSLRAKGFFDVMEKPPPASDRLMLSRITVERVEKWLRTIAAPAAILADNDYWALLVLEACRRLGIRVPKDLAIIGTGNNEGICDLSDPPLTSVAHNDFEVGRRAAEVLAGMLDGATPPRSPVLIPPRDIVARRSTDATVVPDENLAAAVRFIDENIVTPFGVDAVARHVHVSRRWLDKSFKQHFGHTAYEHICRGRIDQARRLIEKNPRMKLRQIARACGFPSPKRMRLIFKRIAGMTPQEFRQAARSR